MSIFKKCREFIIEEKDVTTVLSVINSHLKYSNLDVANCGWANEESSKWFVMFDANDKRYGKIVKDLSTIGEFKLDVRPKGKVDLYFVRKSN